MNKLKKEKSEGVAPNTVEYYRKDLNTFLRANSYPKLRVGDNAEDYPIDRRTLLKKAKDYLLSKIEKNEVARKYRVAIKYFFPEFEHELNLLELPNVTATKKTEEQFYTKPELSMLISKAQALESTSGEQLYIALCI